MKDKDLKNKDVLESDAWTWFISIINIFELSHQEWQQLKIPLTDTAINKDGSVSSFEILWKASCSLKVSDTSVRHKHHRLQTLCDFIFCFQKMKVEAPTLFWSSFILSDEKWLNFNKVSACFPTFLWHVSVCFLSVRSSAAASVHVHISHSLILPLHLPAAPPSARFALRELRRHFFVHRGSWTWFCLALFFVSAGLLSRVGWRRRY